MFREMRRYRQQLTKEECESILRQKTSGVLALQGDDDYPYAVPISYVYEAGKLFFHSAMSGHKIDAVKHCSKASFCVVDQDEIHPEKFTTWFRSVIAFGHIRIVEDADEKSSALRLIGIKYGTDDEMALKAELDKTINLVTILCLDIKHLTGKEAKELAKADGRL